MPPLPKPLTSNNSKSTRKRVPQPRWHAKARVSASRPCGDASRNRGENFNIPNPRVSASRERGNPHPPVAGALRSSARFTETERSRATSPPCPDQRQEYKEQSFLSQRYVAALDGGAPNHQIQRATENQLRAQVLTRSSLSR